MATELEVLGERVLEAMQATYNPDGQSDLALAIHPGQVVADRLVQDGVPNEARINEWLSDQYDRPMMLVPATTTSVVTAALSGRTAKSFHADIAEHARPSLPADAPGFARVESVIAAADKAMGEIKSSVTLGVEPTDFAAEQSTAWQVFDTTVTSTTTTHTEAPAPDPGVVTINRELWQMRPIESELLSNIVLPRLEAEPQLSVARRIDPAILASVRVMLEPQPVLEPEPEPAPPPEAAPVASGLRSKIFTRFNASLVAAQLDSVVAVEPEPQAEPTPPPVKVGPLKDILMSPDHMRVVNEIQLEDLVAQPPVDHTTTTGTELTVHFEYCLLRITRRIFGSPWWSDELVFEDDWYVPGMRRGEMVPEPPVDGTGMFLPQALLAVRNVSITGQWTRQAQEAFTQAASFVGPFLVQPETDVTVGTSEALTVSLVGLGTQVIGELCSPLPVLPPKSDPTLDPQ